MADDKGSAGQSVDLIVKADEILDVLRSRGQATVAEIAEANDEPRSSVYRLLGTLESIGVVEASSDRSTYQIGLRLYHMAQVVRDGMPIIPAALPAMERLAVETGETVFLMAQRDARSALCVHRIDGERVQSMAVAPGGIVPLHLGAGPIVLLAHAPDAEEYLAELPADTAADVRERLARIRETGYGVSDGDLVAGMAAIGAPVTDDGGRVVAALSLSGARAGILGDAEDRIVALVKQTAESIPAIG